jgi:hypothetical protein
MEPLVHHNDLGGIKCLDEWVEGFVGAANQVAATAEEVFPAQPGFRALQAGAKMLEAAAQAEEMVAIVNKGPPGWQDGSELALALVGRFLCFRFFATVLGIF